VLDEPPSHNRLSQSDEEADCGLAPTSGGSFFPDLPYDSPATEGNIPFDQTVHNGNGDRCTMNPAAIFNMGIRLFPGDFAASKGVIVADVVGLDKYARVISKSRWSYIDDE
jgi:hypothetical protein